MEIKTYNTIQDAFDNGKGDSFYSKDGKFICIHRNDIEGDEELLNSGFEFMSYHEVLNEAAKTPRPVKQEPLQQVVIKPEISIGQSFGRQKRSNYIHPDIYEFSDADPGL